MQRHRETIGLWLLAVVFAVACVGLGRWQWHRFEDKHAKARVVDQNYDSDPVPLDQLVPDARRPFDRDLQWRQVSVTGEYDTDRTTLVRNRPRAGGGQDPTYGYEVLVPLRLADGTALLVDRGWLPNGTTGKQPGQAPDSVPAPAAGLVAVVVHLRAGEPLRTQDLPVGQVASINLAEVERTLGYPLRPAYGALVSETPTSATTPAALGRPVLDGNEGVNASYAAQWGLFALLGLGFPIWVARRRRAAALEDQRGEHDDTEGGAEGGSGGGSGGGSESGDVRRPAVASASRRRRIWDADAEDEDAMTD